jgi:hypothetical protein
MGIRDLICVWKHNMGITSLHFVGIIISESQWDLQQVAHDGDETKLLPHKLILSARVCTRCKYIFSRKSNMMYYLPICCFMVENMTNQTLIFVKFWESTVVYPHMFAT